MGLFLVAALQAACPGQFSELSVAFESHLHRKMVTDGKGLEGKGPVSEALLGFTSENCRPSGIKPTGFLQTPTWRSRPMRPEMPTPAAAYRWGRSTDLGEAKNRLEGPLLKLGQGGECQVH